MMVNGEQTAWQTPSSLHPRSCLFSLLPEATPNIAQDSFDFCRTAQRIIADRSDRANSRFYFQACYQHLQECNCRMSPLRNMSQVKSISTWAGLLRWNFYGAPIRRCASG